MLIGTTLREANKLERGATSTCIFRFPESVIFSDIEEMRLYIKGFLSNFLEKSKEQNEIIFLPENYVRVDFSQEETLSFRDNESLSMQFHWRNKDNTARTSEIIKTDTSEFLGSEPI